MAGDGNDARPGGHGAIGEGGVREVGQGLCAEEHERGLAALGHGRELGRGRPTGGVRSGRQERADRLVGGVERESTREEPRDEAHVDGPHHVGSAQRRQERGLRVGGRQRAGRCLDQARVLGQRGPTEHDHHALAVVAKEATGLGEVFVGEGPTLRVGAQGSGGRGVATERPGDQERVTRPGRQADLGEVAERGRAGGEIDDRGLRRPGRRTQPQEQHGELLAQITGEQQDGAGPSGLVDGGPGQGRDERRVEPVAELGIDRVRADDPLEQGRPGEGALVGGLRPADGADPVGAGVTDDLDRAAEGLGPAHRDELPVAAHHGFGDATPWVGDVERVPPVVGTVHRLEREATLVAEPAVVDRLRVHAEQAGQPSGRGLHGHPAADCTPGAGRLDLLEVPRPSGEAVGGGRQGPHRADLDGVAREVRAERLAREGRHLHEVATSGEVDQGLTRHLVGEPGAAAALDAALAVEQDQLGDRDGLGEVSLLLDEAGLAGTVGQGLVLQRALAALVADRAVERVVGEEELEDAVLGLLDLLRVGDDLHALASSDVAGGHEGRAPRALDLDEAHPADADGLHARVVAEARDVGAGALGGGDDHLALLGGHLTAVEGEGDLGVRGLLRHAGTSLR